MKKEDARFCRIFLFLFLKNPDFVGVAHHLTPKKALFLQFCTTLLTRFFRYDILTLEGN